MANINLATLSLGDPFTTSNGSKIASIRSGNGDLVLLPGEFLRVPFEPTNSFGESDSSRFNLVLEAPRPVLEAFADLDEWLISYLTEHAAQFFKKPMTADQVRDGYSSCIRHSDKGYMPTLKTKVDLGDSKHSLCVWDADGNQLDKPESWRNRLITPRLHITHLWFMGSNFGPVVRLTDALLRPDASPVQRTSPF